MSVLVACAVQVIRPGAGGALGGGGLSEGAREGSLHSKLAVLRALLASLEVRASGCIAVHCADGANRLWETVAEADVVKSQQALLATHRISRQSSPGIRCEFTSSYQISLSASGTYGACEQAV